MTALPAREPIRSVAAMKTRRRFTYSVLGGVLSSELDFPELPRAEAALPTWTLRLDERAPAELPLNFLGTRQVGQEEYHLWRWESGFRLWYSHAGTFDVCTAESTITVHRMPDAPDELVRAIVLGPAVTLLLESRGDLCLHGSAVAVGERAVAFVAPKFYGKSTLATALTAAGGRLISDDIVALRVDSPVRIRPGVPSVRLWQDAAREVDLTALCRAVLPGIKTTGSALRPERFADAELDVDAIYLLDPVLDWVGPEACRRTPLAGVASAVALAHQTKLPANLMGPRLAGEQLRSAAAVATRCPVWKLHLVRDFDRLADVVRQLQLWHSAPRSAEAVAGEQP